MLTMSDKDVILKVEGLSKSYFSEQQSKLSIKDLLSNPFRKNKILSSQIIALEDVSFELKRGESLGIIGPNGAGKSTLLKILSGITSPTSGKVTINGRVLSVLDIGTGFHPDLTGKENVYLNGEILGMSRSEIDNRYHEIVEFSGIGEFVDRPVKQYSSGMYLRLAFSIVVTLDADILVFDEVMTVGDFEFKLAARRKIESLMSESKCMVLATHDLSELARTTKHTIILEAGQITAKGKTSELSKLYALEKFENSSREMQTTDSHNSSPNDKPHHIPDGLWKARHDDRILHRDVEILAVRIKNSDYQNQSIYMESNISITISYVKFVEEPVSLAFQINDISEAPVFGSIDMKETLVERSSGEFQCEIIIPGNLLNEGVFLLDIGILDRLDNHEIVVLKTNVLQFKVSFNEGEKGKFWYQSFPGNIRPILNWTNTKTA